jgi:membrane protease subunit (stomatin/prohibitin family)
MKKMDDVATEIIFKGMPEDVIWRSEVTKLKNTAKIYSRKDCDIIFLRKGAFMGAFNDREEFYLVDNEKQGFLSKLFHGENESDDCEIFYINRLAQLENKWGTPNRIDIYDKDYDMHTSVGANGSYKFSINSSMKLLSKVQGAAGSLSQDMVREFFRSELNMEIRNSIANIFYKNKYGLKDIATITTLEKGIANEMKESLEPVFSDYGVRLDKFYISQFSYDDDFLSQLREFKKEAVLKKMKFDSEKEERKEAKEDFKMVTDAAEKLQKSAPKKEIHIVNQGSDGRYCTQCGHKNSNDAKFCSNCGNRL